MKTILACSIFSLAVSVFAYLCMDNHATEAKLVEYANPLGVVLGFMTALQGILHSKKYTGLLGLTQLSFWPLYGFLLAILPPGLILQILLTTLITLYLGASLVLFGLAFYYERWGAAPKNNSP
jgi:hypothetical protein